MGGPASDLRHALWAALLLSVAVLVFCAPMFASDGLRQGDDYRDEDWLHDLSFSLHLGRGLRDGEFPLRSHLVGGGYPILGHPSDGTLSPFSLPFVILPVGAAVRFNLVFLLWLGALGMYGLGRAQLGLGPWAAGAAALAFVFSGWFPSMMLAGFYVQAFYLLVPLALHLLLGRGSGLRRSLAAGLLLLPILLQGGPAIVAVLHFVGLAAVVVAPPDPASGERDPWSATRVLALLLAGSAVVGLAHGALGLGGAVVVCGVAAAAAVIQRPTWSPMALRVAIVVVVLVAVGAAKLASIADLTARGTDYFAVSGDAGYPFGTALDAERSFYSSPASFVGHLQRPLERVTTYDEDFPEAEEYAPLGLTLPVVLLFGLACAFAWRRMAPWALLWLLYGLLCFGPNTIGDPYRLFVWGLPGFSVLSDPYKYFNFFLLIPVALGFGMAVELAVARWGRGALVAAGLLLLWPALQNMQLWSTLFSVPADPLPAASTFHQISLEPPAGFDRFEHPEMYREFFRPDAVREFFTIPAGIGVINWYADIYSPEHPVPRYMIDAAGGRTDAPGWRGAAWADGPCTVAEPRLTANRVEIDVDVQATCTVVINQNHDRGFSSDLGTVIEEQGLLAVRLSVPGVAPGAHRIVLRYRPRWLLAALATSGLSLAAVLALLLLGVPPRGRFAHASGSQGRVGRAHSLLRSTGA